MTRRTYKWLADHGLSARHPANWKYEDVPPLRRLDAPPVIDESMDYAWTVWANTMFLSGGDRAQADRAFDVARKLKKEKP